MERWDGSAVDLDDRGPETPRTRRPRWLGRVARRALPFGRWYAGLLTAATNPERRYLVLLFGGLGVFVLGAGVALALLLQHHVENDLASLSGSLVATTIEGHLPAEVVHGRTTYVVAPPTDTAWWSDLRDRLGSMVGARGVHALDATGALAGEDAAGASGLRPVPAASWARVLAGQSTQYIRGHDARDLDLSGPVFGVVVPVVFRAADGATAAGGLALEMSAAPLLRQVARVRDLMLLSAGGALVVLLVLLWLLTRRLTMSSFRDPLTGLANRRYFESAASLMLARNQRYGRPSAVLVVDVNRFKEVNDSLGHPVGDRILKSLARSLVRHVRAGDYVARIGGDEFALLVSEADVEQARVVAQRITTALEGATALDARHFRVTTSIGIAAHPHHGGDLDELLRSADAAMYRAKRGQVPFAVFDAASDHPDGHRLLLESDLRDALASGALEVHYQPVVAAADARLVGYEALARWEREGQPVSPAVFIDLAYDTGLIRALDRYVFERAVQRLALSPQRGAGLTVSVNLSAQSLGDGTLPAFLRGVAERHGVSTRQLMLEVTENAAVQDLGRATATLATLRELGFRVALDDFGTGYSSLAYLRKLPIEVVKIDRQFVDGIGREPGDEHLIRAVVLYVKALDLRTLAEGVETPEQHRWLQEQGIDYEQGYLHGRPAPHAAPNAVREPGPQAGREARPDTAPEAVRDTGTDVVPPAGSGPRSRTRGLNRDA